MKTYNIPICRSVQELMAHSRRLLFQAVFDYHTTVQVQLTGYFCHFFSFSFAVYSCERAVIVQLSIHLSETSLDQIQAPHGQVLCTHSTPLHHNMLNSPFHSLQLRLHLALSLTSYIHFQLLASPENRYSKTSS